MPSMGAGRRSFGMEIEIRAPRQLSTSFLTAEVFYLLSRGDQLEHPHMINVRFAEHQPGPSLRDVKVRLIAARGKGMPDSFCWSYKRNYRDTFIWCDLFDDDFIHPLSGSGEYVLKAMKLFDAPRRSTLRLDQHLICAEDDVAATPRNSLVLIGDAESITSDSSMDLNTQIMNSINPHSSKTRALPEEICNPDHSDVSRNGTFQSLESNIVVESKEQRSELRPREEDSVFSPSPATNPRDQAPAKRRTWQKEVDKITIYSDLDYTKCPDDEDPVTVTKKSDVPCSAARQDLFLYILKKATKLGLGFRPRLCTGVDVVNSTRTKTKVNFRSKTQEEGSEGSFKTSVKHK